MEKEKEFGSKNYTQTFDLCTIYVFSTFFDNQIKKYIYINTEKKKKRKLKVQVLPPPYLTSYLVRPHCTFRSIRLPQPHAIQDLFFVLKFRIKIINEYII